MCLHAVDFSRSTQYSADRSTLQCVTIDNLSAKPQHNPSVFFCFQLATTVCYHSVLQEVLAYAGRALELLVQGLQSQEEIVPDMSLALFLQLCSRQEGAQA